MWRLFSRTICLLVWYRNLFLFVCDSVSEYISSTYNRCLSALPPAATAPFHYEFFSSLPFTLSVRLSFCNLLCVRYTHTHTHLGRRRHRLVRRRRRLLCRESGRCEEVWYNQCVCERRYRQVVFIIIVFFPDGYDETPTVHVHNNIQQQYKSFVNNTSTLAARRRVVAPPSKCVVVSEWGVPVVRENKMYTRLLSRHETVYQRFIYWNSSYFTLIYYYVRCRTRRRRRRRANTFESALA